MSEWVICGSTLFWSFIFRSCIFTQPFRYLGLSAEHLQHSHFSLLLTACSSSQKSAAEERDTLQACIAKYNAGQLHANAVPTRYNLSHAVTRTDALQLVQSDSNDDDHVDDTQEPSMSTGYYRYLRGVPAGTKLRHGAGPLRTFALLFAKYRCHYCHKKRLSYLPFSYKHRIAPFKLVHSLVSGCSRVEGVSWLQHFTVSCLCWCVRVKDILEHRLLRSDRRFSNILEISICYIYNVRFNMIDVWTHTVLYIYFNT